jgi:hypothetical protein
MADLVISSSLVQPGHGAPITWGIAADNFTQAGVLAYRDRADRDRIKKADALTFAKAEVVGVTVCAASTGQPIVLQTDWTYRAGCELTVGQTYIVSTNAGGVATIEDLAVGSCLTIWGVAVSNEDIAIARFVSEAPSRVSGWNNFSEADWNTFTEEQWNLFPE